MLGTMHSVGVALLKAGKLAVPEDKLSLQPGLAGAQAGTKRALCGRDAQGDGQSCSRGVSRDTKRGEAQRGTFPSLLSGLKSRR